MALGIHKVENLATISCSMVIISDVNPGCKNDVVIGSNTFTSIRCNTTMLIMRNKENREWYALRIVC